MAVALARGEDETCAGNASSSDGPINYEPVAGLGLDS